jgi:hypothetical protein
MDELFRASLDKIKTASAMLMPSSIKPETA